MTINYCGNISFTEFDKFLEQHKEELSGRLGEDGMEDEYDHELDIEQADQQVWHLALRITYTVKPINSAPPPEHRPE